MRKVDSQARLRYFPGDRSSPYVSEKNSVREATPAAKGQGGSSIHNGPQQSNATGGGNGNNNNPSINPTSSKSFGPPRYPMLRCGPPICYPSFPFGHPCMPRSPIYPYQYNPWCPPPSPCYPPYYGTPIPCYDQQAPCCHHQPQVSCCETKAPPCPSDFFEKCFAKLLENKKIICVPKQNNSASSNGNNSSQEASCPAKPEKPACYTNCNFYVSEALASSNDPSPAPGSGGLLAEKDKDTAAVDPCETNPSSARCTTGSQTQPDTQRPDDEFTKIEISSQLNISVYGPENSKRVGDEIQVTVDPCPCPPSGTCDGPVTPCCTPSSSSCETSVITISGESHHPIMSPPGTTSTPDRRQLILDPTLRESLGTPPKEPKSSKVGVQVNAESIPNAQDSYMGNRNTYYKGGSNHGYGNSLANPEESELVSHGSISNAQANYIGKRSTNGGGSNHGYGNSLANPEESELVSHGSISNAQDNYTGKRSTYKGGSNHVYENSLVNPEEKPLVSHDSISNAQANYTAKRSTYKDGSNHGYGNSLANPEEKKLISHDSISNARASDIGKQSTNEGGTNHGYENPLGNPKEDELGPRNSEGWGSTGPLPINLDTNFDVEDDGDRDPNGLEDQRDSYDENQDSFEDQDLDRPGPSSLKGSSAFITSEGQQRVSDRRSVTSYHPEETRSYRQSTIEYSNLEPRISETNVSQSRSEPIIPVTTSKKKKKKKEGAGKKRKKKKRARSNPELFKDKKRKPQNPGTFGSARMQSFGLPERVCTIYERQCPTPCRVDPCQDYDYYRPPEVCANRSLPAIGSPCGVCYNEYDVCIAAPGASESEKPDITRETLLHGAFPRNYVSSPPEVSLNWRRTETRAYATRCPSPRSSQRMKQGSRGLSMPGPPDSGTNIAVLDVSFAAEGEGHGIPEPILPNYSSNRSELVLPQLPKARSRPRTIGPLPILPCGTASSDSKRYD